MSNNEVAMQTCLMGVQAGKIAIAQLEARVAVLESKLAGTPVPEPQPQAVAPPPPPAAAVAVPAVPVMPPGGRRIPAVTVTPPPGGAAGPVFGGALGAHATALGAELGAKLGPWAGLVSTVLESAVRELAPHAAALLASAQGHPVPAAGVAAPPPALPPGAAEMTAPGPVEAGELAWMAAEGLATGLPVEAIRTTALPPNYQHPPGVVPVPPAAAPVVPMPPLG